MELAAALAVPLAFTAAFGLAWPAARRTVGLLHPIVLWLALEAVFFGVGAIVLAIVDGRPGPALYVAGAVVAAGIGTWISDRLSRGRESGEVGATAPPVAEPATRPLAAPFLGVAAILAIVPTVLATGIPLLSGDVTAARTEIAGFAVQLVRVALPGLAVVWVLETAAGRPPFGRRELAPIALLGALGLTLSLGSRYLPLELGAAVVIGWLLSGRRLPAARSVVALVLAAMVFVGFGVGRAGDQAAADPVRFAMERTTSRLFLVQPRTLAALQDRIPAEEPYFLGATWLRRLGPLVGRDIPNLGYWIYPRVVPGAQATAGYAAPGLVGEAWANFGPAGLGLFLLLGIGAERLGAIAVRRRTGPVDLAAAALAILFLARTHALGLMGLALLVGLVLAWRWLAGSDAGLAQELRAAAGWRLGRDRATTVPPIT